MKQVVQNFRTGKLEVAELPPPSVRDGGVLVKTAYSLISAGTERSTVQVGQSNLLGKAKQRPDLVKKTLESAKREGAVVTFKKVMNRLDSPKALGYSSSGIVVEVGREVDEFKVGDRVACAGGGYASHADYVYVPKNLCASLPKDAELDAAAFTTVGAIAMQGVRQAAISVGDRVAVIGLGLVGMLVLQILKTSGCKVLGIDVDPARIMLARELGANDAIVRSDDRLDAMVSSFTNGYGFDSVIIAAGTKSNDPIELAGKIARDRGVVSVVGAVNMDVPRDIYYEKELEIKLSRSYGPGRYDHKYEEQGVDYPIGYVKWTEKRNMEAFLGLLAENKVDVAKLITHKFDIDDASLAYEMITGKSDEDYIGVLLKYAPPDIRPTRVSIKEDSAQGDIAVGFIGAGNFAQAHLLPHIQRSDKVDLGIVATANGINARNAAAKFGFRQCSADYKEAINDPAINCLFVATRHDMHGPLVLEAINKGLSIFVEKPLTISERQLGEIAAAYRSNPVRLMVGFNRRFSPMAELVKTKLGDIHSPISVNYRVNAGFIPKDHWIQDPVEGGGRIIGEMCHFIDFIQYMAGSLPVKIYAQTIRDPNQAITNNDTVSITIKFEDGSLGNIDYMANGDSSLEKERIEVFAGGSVFIIDDFKKMTCFEHSKSRKIKNAVSGKGHKQEVEAFLRSIEKGRPSPISFESIVATTASTFAILKSIETGQAVDVGYI